MVENLVLIEQQPVEVNDDVVVDVVESLDEIVEVDVRVDALARLILEDEGLEQREIEWMVLLILVYSVEELEEDDMLDIEDDDEVELVLIVLIVVFLVLQIDEDIE